MNFLSTGFELSRCLMNCFVGTSHVTRNPEGANLDALDEEEEEEGDFEDADVLDRFDGGPIPFRILAALVDQ
eukprot:CAMPEP_0118708874 /NCGR_PEP_ID=MMETSP0800-20121206/22226_1 /TAXON_ID=210618 ORGANISM="Striatella unipunctata, Strain CCMP2910" /NCGR_SAMPLE_ID=MMETSP0800 /ASSEMBLY_ACC=CAM_ASM_000638 /LENGTH=71 /DNA_ID=CAMNT_0006612309 /DNA_START=1236 /DNA_END=1451 /DNA_ORIENTATION=+